MSGTQLVTFFIHWILLFPTLYYAFRAKKEARWIYTNMAFGWFVGIVYYAALVEPLSSYISLNMHVVSPYLRIVQGVCFGSWVLIKFVEELCASISCRKLGDKIWKSAKDERQ